MSTIHESSNVASRSSTPPGVSDQATGSCTLSSVNEQVTSSLTPSPDVSKQAVNFFRRTSKTSSVQRDVDGQEMREYLRMVSADKYADYLHVIDNDADYLRVIDNDADYLHVVDDNHATVSEAKGSKTIDNVESQNEAGCQQQGYHPLIEDDDAYQEIAVETRPTYVQVVDTDCNYEHVVNDEQTQAQATSTGETSVNTTANSHQLQQVAVYGLAFKDERVGGVNNPTKRRLSILLILAAAVGAVLLACSVVIYFEVKPSSANTIEAFGIMRTRQDLPIFDGLLTFDSVIMNVISTSVDLTSSSLTAPQTPSQSLYWMIIAVEVPIQTSALVHLANTNLIMNKTFSNNSDNDIITKSGLVRLEPAIEVTLQSAYAVGTAYWSGFCLNNIMQSLVAVFVASSKQLASDDSNSLTKIAYDIVIINEGKAWDTENDVFVVPQSGIYVFSISIGFTSPHNPAAMLGVSTWSHRQNLTIGQAGMGQIISSDVDFISASCVLHLVEGATVEGMFSNAESIYSDPTTLDTSLSAFRYSPASNKQVLWSVAIITPELMFSPFKTPLPYDYVRFNIGGAWQPSQNTVVIATPGIYYVFVAVNVCSTNNGATLWLQVNEERSLEIKSTMSADKEQTRNNGAIIRLNTDDKLTVEVADESQTCLYGSEDGINSFMGLLLTPASV